MKSEKLLREVFVEAAEIENSEVRAAYLDEACDGDEAFRERVESLLTFDSQGELSKISEPFSPVLEPELGLLIGPYKLLERIGEGGCGVVYMAEQDKPVRRQVALKIIKLGMDTKQVIARFEAERQVLAMMDHPNIAKVFDAGATETGRPYFVMELVRGMRITDYCDESQMPPRERLELFVRVCQAVQHAHQKGIIHRDLKPSNILVTEVDSEPTPKIIDFGIAKAIEGRLTEQTLFTAIEQLIGTPAYMSPEQAASTTVDIDTRTDVYSLGVLLYELLSGQTPFDSKALMNSGVDALRQTIRETEPQPPSTRLSELAHDNGTSTARSRGTEPARLASQLKGDLDWIVMKCLEKERKRRYGSAESLAADVSRHLRNEVVTARPPSLAYRVQRSFQRNRLAFSATAAVSLSLILGLGAAIQQYRDKDRALGRAVLAEKEQTRLREVADAANDRSRKDLRNSLINQAHLATLSSAVAQRDSAVSALARAAEMESTADMVEIAVTALSMFQVRDLGVVIPRIDDQVNVAINPQITRYVWYGRKGSALEVRSYPENALLREFAGSDSGLVDYLDWYSEGDGVLVRRRSGPLEFWRFSTRQVEWSHLVREVKDGAQDYFVGLVEAKSGAGFVAHKSGSSVEIIDVSNGARVARLEPESRPMSLAFHPTASWIAIGTESGIEVVSWPDKRNRFRRKSGKKCTGLAWSPDGQVIAHAGPEYKLELWDVVGEPLAVSRALGGLYSMTPCWSSAGRWLAGSDEQGVMTLWNGRLGRAVLERLNGFPLGFSEDGSRLYRRTGDSGVSAYELSESSCYHELEVPFYADSSLPGLAISPDERWVAATSYAAGVHIWDLEKGGPPVKTYAMQTSSAMFNETGTQLLTCSEQGVNVWEFAETQSGPELKGPVLFEGQTGSSRYLTHTFGSERAVVVSTLPAVWSFPLSDFSKPTQLTSRDQQSAAINPDGRWLVESSYYEPVFRRDLRTNEVVDDVSPRGGLAAFSPDGRWLTVGRGGAVEAWNTESWEPAWQVSTRTVKQETGLCVFRPQGDLLATLETPHDIMLLRPSDGRKLMRLKSPRPGPVNRICFDGSGRTLLASTEDGRVQIWKLDELERQLAEIGLNWCALNGMSRIAASE